ncbi:unnamed protein product [Rhodiola kirilowii]
MAALQMGVLCSDGRSCVQFVPGLSSNCGFGYKKKKMKSNMVGCGDMICCRPMSVSMRHVESKTNVDSEVEFKPSFGQYLKVMETVKIKRKERKYKSDGDKDCELGEGARDKGGEKLKADKLEEKKTGLRSVVGGARSVEKFGRMAVQEGLKDAESSAGYGKDYSKREFGVNVRNVEGRASTNVKWTRKHEGSAREKLNELDKGVGKTSVWKKQRSPHARENNMEMGTDVQSNFNMNPYDRQEGFSPRAQVSDLQKGKFSKLETHSRYEKDNGGGFKSGKMSPYDRQEGFSSRAQISDVQKGKLRKLEMQSRYEDDYVGGFKSDKMNPYDRQEVFSPSAQIYDVRKGKFQKFEMQSRYKKDNGLGFKGENRTSEMDARKFNKTDISSREIMDDESFGMDRAAFKNLEVIDEGRVSRMLMEERLQRLAKMLNGADIDMPEWMFSRTMRSAQIRFTDHTIMRVIQILGKLGNWRRALQVIEWLQMSERFKSHKLRFIYTAALDVLGKARRPVEAFNLFTAMQQQMTSYPDLVAYHSIAVTLGQAGHMKELFDVIDIMRSPPRKNFNKGVFEKWDPRLEPDIVVYNAVLNACVKRKNWEGAFWVLQQLDQQKIELSSTTYGLVMEVMYACGKYNLVHEFFEKMKKFFIPNALTYRVLVNTLWKEGKPDEAVLAVNQMERRGIIGSAALYYDLARCLCSMGRCKEALMQMEKISKVANKPLVVTYTGLIQACLDSANVKDARFILNRMHGICSPNLVTYNIMLKAYVKSGLFEEAKELYFIMSEDGTHRMNKSDIKDRVLPDIYTFNTLLDATAAAGRWDHFEYFYVQMLQHGFHFNAKRHLRMILDAARANKGELVETTWTHLAHSGRSPPVPLILERFCLRLENDDVAAATSCITSLASSDLGGNGKVRWANVLKDNAQRFKQESVARLMNEIARRQSDSPNPILDIFTTCCEEFLRNSTSSGEKIVN